MDVATVERTRADRRWDSVRLAVVFGWLLLAVTVGAVGARTSSWADVREAVASGEVDSVEIVGPLPDGATGYGTVDVLWRSGLWQHRAQVVQVRGSGNPSDKSLSTTDDVTAVLHEEPGAVLLDLQPGLDVQRSGPLSTSASLYGWSVPGWLGLAGFGLIVAVLAAVVAGPEPWRATRWAWFWLLFTPVGSLAFVVLSGPTPLVPAPRDPQRRLRGGLALLVTLMIGALL